MQRIIGTRTTCRPFGDATRRVGKEEGGRQAAPGAAVPGVTPLTPERSYSLGARRAVWGFADAAGRVVTVRPPGAFHLRITTEGVCLEEQRELARLLELIEAYTAALDELRSLEDPSVAGLIAKTEALRVRAAEEVERLTASARDPGASIAPTEPRRHG